MLKQILERGARAFGRTYDYDVSYMLDVIETSTSAGLRLTLFPKLVGYRGPKPGQGVVAGATLASTVDGDCGPCAQLVVDMLLQADVPAAALQACIDGRAQDAGDIGLGFRFAMAAITAAPDTDALADEITHRFGRKTLVAASYGAASGWFYPVFKRGLGHGATCQRLRFAGAGDVLVNAHG